MSTCKECKYFVKKEASKGLQFNPQPFGQQRANPVNPGSCYLYPPNMNGQHVTVSENDWCGQFTPKNLESALNDVADDITE